MELKRVGQADMRLVYDEEKLQAAYDQYEAMFAREFKDFMTKLGAKRLEE